MKALIVVVLILISFGQIAEGAESFRKTSADFAKGDCEEVVTGADIGVSCEKIREGDDPCKAQEGSSTYLLECKKQMMKRYEK